jgi:hypothetical protein
MALQLLKRNYTLNGYEAPRILKLPQGEERWAPRRLPVDIGDIMMNIRMNDDKNKYIGEHISKYAQGLNPYGEWGYPYKVNKNNIRPPIIDPKYYEALSRMPVKFESVTAGPIVKNLYQKRDEISKIAPNTIIDRICPEASSKPSYRKDDVTNKNTYHEGNINLHLKQPHSSLPYHPSMPVHLNTGVPDIELDGKIITRPQMGIHFPFHVSDQSRDIYNMRTPMHVALRPGYKDPYTTIQITPEDISGINADLQNVAAGSGFQPSYTFEPDINNNITLDNPLQTSVNSGYQSTYKLEPQINTNIPLEPGIQTAAQTNIIAPIPTADNLNHEAYDLTPKVQTSAWYNPSFYLTDLSGYSIGNTDQTCITDDKPKTSAQATASYKMNLFGNADVPITTRNALHAARTTNVNSRLLQQGKLGKVQLRDIIQPGEFKPKAVVPTIQEHQSYNRTRETRPQEYHFIQNMSNYGQPSNEINQSIQNQLKNRTGIRNKLNVQQARVDRTGLEPPERVIPVGTGRFIYNTF